MAGIFLSYARDNARCAKALASALEDAGHEVWWDRHLDSGEDFAAEIEAELGRADVVLVAWSKESVKSRWVRDEAAIGGDTGRLIPISIDGTPPPMGFRQFHTADLTGWTGSKRDGRTAELLRSIERRVTGKASTAAAPGREIKRRFAIPKRSLAWVFAALLVLTIAAGAFWLVPSRARRGPPSAPTIALLPFGQNSSDPAVRELALQTRDSLAHMLSASGMPIKLVSAVPQSGSAPGDYVMSGEMSGNADKVLATVRLEDSVQRVTVFSRRFEADRASIRSLPDRIGAQIAGSLGWAGALRMLDDRSRSDPTITALFFQQLDLLGDPLRSYQLARTIVLKTPNSSNAQMSVAFETAFALEELPPNQRAEAVTIARRAAERAQALDPDYGEVHIPWCLLHSEVRRIECEDHLRAGMRIDSDAPFVTFFLSALLSNVGRIDEAFDQARQSHVHDPYMPEKIARMIHMLEVTGDSEAATSLYRDGTRWWPEFPGLFRARASGITERGDFEALLRFEREAGAEHQSGYQASSAFVAALKNKSTTGLKPDCANGGWFFQVRCVMVLAKLGDLDAAFALADPLYPGRVGRNPAEQERIWLDKPSVISLEFITSPAAAPLRRDPRYLALAQRTGLLEYWRSGRAPDFCRKQPEPICAQLLKRR